MPLAPPIVWCEAECGNTAVEGSHLCKECGMPYYRVETVEQDARVVATHDVAEDETTDKTEVKKD